MENSNSSLVEKYLNKKQSDIECTIPNKAIYYPENDYDHSLMIKPESDWEEISKTRT